MNRYINADLKPVLKKLEVTTKKVMPTLGLTGSHKATFKGGGLDFRDYRNYSPADDAQKIDWKASLRSDSLLVREFIEERNLNVMVLVDTGDSMIFGSEEKLKCEYAVEVMGNIAYAVLANDDSFGYMLHSDSVKARLKPKIGNKQFFQLSKDLIDVNNYGGVFNFSKAINNIMSLVKETSILIIISDFTDLDSNWESALKTAAAKYDIIAIMVRDKRDRELPKEQMQVVLENVTKKKKELVDTKTFGKEYKIETIKQEKMLRETFIKMGCDFLPLINGEKFSQKLLKLFRYRGGF